MDGHSPAGLAHGTWNSTYFLIVFFFPIRISRLYRSQTSPNQPFYRASSWKGAACKTWLNPGFKWQTIFAAEKVGFHDMSCFSSFPSTSPLHVNHSLKNSDLKWKTFGKQMGYTNTREIWAMARGFILLFVYLCMCFLFFFLQFLLFRNVLNNTIFERERSCYHATYP